MHTKHTNMNINIRTVCVLILYSNEFFNLRRHATWHVTEAAVVASAVRSSGVSE